MSYTAHLDGVALCTDPDCDYQYLPNRNPYDHQRELEELFQQHEKFAAMDTAPTGGGKTDAWLYPIMERQLDTIAFYPRNSLIADQKEAIREFATEFDADRDVEILHITKDTLDQRREEELGDPRKGKVLASQIHRARQKSDVVIMLTNPDIFVQMRRDMYRENSVLRELMHFEVAVSDEFHMCNRKQRNTLLDILEAMYDRDEKYVKLKKVLFLSATPERELEQKLNHLHFDFYMIRSEIGRKPLSQADIDGYDRAIMPCVDLELREARTFSAYSKMFSEDQLEDTLEFCLNAGENGALIIVDSLEEVNRAYNALQEYLPDDKTIHRISGLHKENKAKKLRTFDFLVSNSAIEVGIDFDVDRILFSAADADSLIQRLGRLRNKNTVSTGWKARCYVDRDVVDAFRQLPDTDGRITRQGFEFIVNDTHRSGTTPSSFAHRYSALEMYYTATSMDQQAGNFTPDSRTEYIAKAVDRIKRHCYDLYDVEWNGEEELNRLMAEVDSDLMDHLKTYRSKSIQTLIYDRVDDQIRMYNPFQLIRTMDAEFVSKDDFYARVPPRHHSRAENEEPYADGFAIYDGLADGQDDDDMPDVGIIPSQRLRREIAADIESRQPIVTTGLQLSVDQPSAAPGLRYLNAELETSEFLCYPLNGVRVDKIYNVGPFTTLHDVHDVRDKMQMAMGHDALYLHCAVLDNLDNE